MTQILQDWYVCTSILIVCFEMFCFMLFLNSRLLSQERWHVCYLFIDNLSSKSAATNNNTKW